MTDADSSKLKNLLRKNRPKPKLKGAFSIFESFFSLHIFVFFVVVAGFMLLAGLNIPSGLADVGVNISMGLVGLSLVRYLLILIFSLAERFRVKPKIGELADASVTIVMPAFNEEKTIEATIISLCQIEHPNTEIIVVDDGSTDNTYAIAKRTIQSLYPRNIQLIKKANGGKASALNVGIARAAGEFILNVDADSIISPDAISQGLVHFNQRSVAAVGGFVAVFNANNWILRNQQMEYFLSLNFTRQALAFFGVVTVVPGPVGLFRASVLKEIGGYIEDDSLYAEDAEITVRMLANGYRIAAEPAMVSRTQGPKDLFDLFRQRYRWKRGLFQALMNNLDNLFNPFELRKTLIGCWLIVDQLFFEILNFGLALFFMTYFISRGEVQWPFVWIATLILMDVVTLCLCCPKKGFWPLWIFHLMMQKISYTLILQMWSILALVDEWFGVPMSWDKLDREVISAEEVESTTIITVENPQ